MTASRAVVPQLLVFACMAGATFAVPPNSPRRVATTETIAAHAKRGVVVVECRAPEEKTVLGSGFLVDRAGLVATNAHVVAGCDEILVRPGSATEGLSATAISLDVDKDIAILYVGRISGTPLPLGRTSELRPGQKVVAIGNPEGLEFTVSDGIISAVRDIDHSSLIQTTAPISPGSSGGPLLDMAGRVVGMTTLFLTKGQNLNFAVAPEDIADAVAASRLWVQRHASDLAEPPKGWLPPIVTPASLASYARDLMDRGEFSRARSLLEPAVRRWPDDKALLLALADVCLHDGGDLALGEEAVRAESMLRIDPSFAPAHAHLALVALNRNQSAEANAEAEKTLSLGADGCYAAIAHLVLGTDAASRQDMAGVVDHLKQTLDCRMLSSGFGSVHFILAVAYLNTGHKQDANKEAKLALELGVDDDSRAKLKAAGLPLGVRVVSAGQSEEDKILGVPVMKGVVVNDGTDSVSFVRVIVECRNSAHKVLLTGTGYVVPQTLVPGESGSFEIEVRGPGGPDLTCQARIVETGP